VFAGVQNVTDITVQELFALVQLLLVQLQLVFSIAAVQGWLVCLSVCRLSVISWYRPIISTEADLRSCWFHRTVVQLVFSGVNMMQKFEGTTKQFPTSQPTPFWQSRKPYTLQLSVKDIITMKSSRKWVSSVLRPHQHSIGYTGDGFYRSKDPTNSIKVLEEMLQNTKKTTKTTKDRYT